mgnify:CR=1 FL=1
MQGFDPHKAHIEVAHPYLTMMGLYLGGFTGMFSETSLNIALPQLTEAFGVDVAVMQWMSSATCWSSASCCPSPACS